MGDSEQQRSGSGYHRALSPQVESGFGERLKRPDSNDTGQGPSWER
jgi:hypothetical protein